MTGKSAAAKKKGDSKLAVKKTAGKGKAAAKDPNMPKRPAGPFFIFMEDFRKQFKKENPSNKSVAAVGKAGGAKWKSFSAAEKGPFEAIAEKRKKQHEKDMDAYNKKLAAGGKDKDIEEDEEEGEESDKSKSEVNNEEEEDDSEEDEDDD